MGRKSSVKIEWTPFRELFVRYKHLFALILLPVSGVWFLLLETINTQPTYFMYSTLDDLIPFVKEMVAAYYSWFLLLAVALVFLFLRAPKDFKSLCYYMYGMQMAVCVIYAFFPNGQYLRKEITGSDFFLNWIRDLYSVDTAANSMPSLHTTHTIACWVALWRYRGGGKHRTVIMTLLTVWCLMILASTMMTKQHSIIDVVAGVTLAFAAYPLVYIFRKNAVEEAPVRPTPLFKLVKKEEPPVA